MQGEIKFYYGSELLSLAQCLPRGHNCIWKINDQEIRCSSTNLALFGEFFANRFKLDATQSEFETDCTIFPESIEVIRQIIDQPKFKKQLKIQIVKDLFEIGRIIKNRKLMKPYSKYLDTLDSSTPEILEEKFKTNYILGKDTGYYINQFALNFSKYNTDNLVPFLLNLDFDTVEQIFTNENLCIDEEEQLLSVVLSLSNFDKKYFNLIKYIDFRCIPKIYMDDLKGFIINNYRTNELLPFLESIFDIYDSEKKYIHKTEKQQEAEMISTEYIDPGRMVVMNGLATSKLDNGTRIDPFPSNTIIRSSSRGSAVANITLSFGCLAPKSYYVGLTDDFKPKSWKLEGKPVNSDDNQLVKLHKVDRVERDGLFTLNLDRKLKKLKFSSFKLTMLTDNSSLIEIKTFDIIGTFSY
ncbi:hypothetical protein TVAG_061260 [Trichomonas vaginalis G3]|uniref:Uncharacterized protein n=1 Tax=Trichomonas vaginalis (strain ATCC PRA-98 / G3) TaxID=412133 RepID=A2FYJ3_TRIV3|nr:protein ubiquitination [Trichomonas vaginalis G3]EAX90018.1 hypothetical protein TVAG_061260 [Trichomonas vaginalis G3]KAI5535289.1 protein ubiquitination [Trichomonas vaginalis G3]|eukprot:XP_001302948.1 hypothetical protein [Trichomonas vaginalis G3]